MHCYNVFLLMPYFMYLHVGLVVSHVRLICPRPLSPRSNVDAISATFSFGDQHTVPTGNEKINEKALCGSGDEIHESYVTDVQPGPLTISFEETEIMEGSPFRVILQEIAFPSDDVDNSNNTNIPQEMMSCLLLDHIPHNRNAVVTKTCSQKGNAYPLGVCTESTYRVTIRIPEVSCRDCLLVLQQVIVPEDGECDLSSELNSELNNGTNCSSFVSCARVRIRSTGFGHEKNLSSCNNYLSNLPGDWPYRPKDHYNAEENIRLSMDLLHDTLHVTIPRDISIAPVERVEIIHSNISVLWNRTIVLDEDLNQGNITVSWMNLSEEAKMLLKNNELILLVTGMYRSLAPDVLLTSQDFLEGRYSSLSSSRWLMDSKFLNPLFHNDTDTVIPMGPCAPPDRFFMSILDSIHVKSHGIVGMAVLGNWAYITAVLHAEEELLQKITIKGPDLFAIPPIEIDLPARSEAVVQAAFDISKQLPYMDSVHFFKTVEVTTDKEKAVLVGDLEEGMYAVLRDERGKVSGIGAFQLTQGLWMRVQMAVIGSSPKIKSAVAMGLTETLFDHSRETVHCSSSFCCTDTFVQELSSNFFLYQMEGLAYLHVQTEGSRLSGKVQGLSTRYCHASNGSCFGVKMKSDGDLLSEEYGWREAATFILDRANTLHFSVQVANINNSTPYSASLTREGNLIGKPALLQAAPALTNTYSASASVPLDASSELLEALAGSTQSPVQLVIQNGQGILLTQDLPPTIRGKCLNRKIFVVGSERKQYWSPASAPLQDMYALVQDHIKFIYDKNTTLFIMPSQDAFTQCDFDQAQQLQDGNALEEHQFYFRTLTHPGTLYFADINSCNSSQPAKLTVHVVEAENMVQNRSHDEWCRTSVYSVWRMRQVARWKEPTVAGNLLIGLVVGLISSGVFLLWQVVRSKKLSSFFPSPAESVFVRF